MMLADVVVVTAICFSYRLNIDCQIVLILSLSGKELEFVEFIGFVELIELVAFLGSLIDGWLIGG